MSSLFGFGYKWERLLVESWDLWDRRKFATERGLKVGLLLLALVELFSFQYKQKRLHV